MPLPRGGEGLAQSKRVAELARAGGGCPAKEVEGHVREASLKLEHAQAEERGGATRVARERPRVEVSGCGEIASAVSLGRAFKGIVEWRGGWHGRSGGIV